MSVRPLPAILAVVLGTDPDLLVLLEATASDSGVTQWRAACARFSNWPMRVMLARTLVLAVFTGAAARFGAAEEQPAANPAPPTELGETDRADEFLQLARDEAAAFTVRTDGDRDATVQLEHDPLLRWSNPVVGEIYGGVFLWTREGRPVFAAAIYKWYSPFTHRGTELVSLSSHPFTVDRDVQEIWSPAGPGVEFAPIAEAPVPADSSAARARQMRELARQFAAAETDRDGNQRDLRLLTHPVYRYTRSDPAIIDGAIFAFVLGTDPEALLLIEARRTAEGVEWQRALARMNSVRLLVRHGERETWRVETLPWSDVNDRSQPYTAIRRDQ